jgi:methionyl-tRNA formyltransferase
MRIVFAGTPEFARSALIALAQAGHDIAAVYTQPDRPAGRGQQLQPSAVKREALARGLAVEQPASLRDSDAQTRLVAYAPEVMVVAAYGLLLPQAVLDIPALGCLNIHASLLPRWRGAAPIQRAIEAGDTLTGITIMQMEAGLDTGPMLLTRTLPITAQDTGATVHDKLADLGAQAIVAALEDLPGLMAQAQRQPAEGVTYAAKLSKAQAQLDWNRPADELALQIRAFDPVPGCWTEACDGSLIKVWAATAIGEPIAAGVPKSPGTLTALHPNAFEVACGEGVLRITEVQRPGGKRLPCAQANLSQWLKPGDILKSPVRP